MVEIGLGVAFFTVTVMGLVVIILVARSALVKTGEVSMTINNGKTMQAPVGRKLLGVLVDAGIHVPSACGGIGTCAMCRVTVLAGGGAILPIERARITRRDAAAGVRLACQVVLKQDMQIQVPEEIFGAQQWQCTVRSTRSVTPLIKEIVLALPAGESLHFRAGSFIEVVCPPYQAKFIDFALASQFHEEWRRLQLWWYASVVTSATTRAYSLANYPEEQDIALLLIRLALPPPGAPDTIPPGAVSSYLFSLTTGDTVTISGPFGHFFATTSEAEMIFVGGGVGMAPMRSHLFDQLKRLHTRRKITFWYGARSRQELFYVEDFARLQAEHDNFQWFVALSEPGPADHWQGYTGFIHEVLYQQYLKDHPQPEDCEYYLCGPPMMLKAVTHLLDSVGVEPDNIRFDDFGG